MMIFPLCCRNTLSVEEQAFIKDLKDKGFKIRNVPRDGNCQFHAVSDQLMLKSIKKKKHDELRKMAVAQLRDNPEEVSHS